jgi:cyanophycinase-like exopeptidase
MQHDPHPDEARETRRRPGPVALVGSGEYTPAMDATDRHLLALIGGSARARVALLPTASGLEPGRPAYWNDLGLAHFRALGVADVRATTILDVDGARDPANLALLRDATFFYFSGGDPVHLIASLRDSPAWEIIARAHAAGAVLAGCSAGAMALGAGTVSPRRLRAGEAPRWHEALGVVSGVMVFPHFDRMRASWPDAFETGRRTAPAGITLLGIDEDTALVWDGGDPEPTSAGPRWRVFGRQRVTVYPPAAGQPHVLRAGDEVHLPPPPST